MSDAPDPAVRQKKRKTESFLPDVLRPLPQSADAEKALLGSILLCPQQVLDECVSGQITAGHFLQPANALVYSVLLEMQARQLPIDLVSLTQYLTDTRRLDQAGGAVHVTDLFTFVPTAANAPFYADIVREKFLLRQIISVCDEYSRRSHDEQGDVRALLGEFEGRALAISQNRAQRQRPSIQQLAINALDTIENLYRNKGAVMGVPSGFAELDRITNGFHPGEMIVIAARPGMGKTSFAMNIVEHAALEAEKCVAVYSLEMSSEQIVLRSLCSIARVDLNQVRNGFLDKSHLRSLTTSTTRLSKSRIFIDDTPGISIQELQSNARRLHAQNQLDLIVIDYLQLMRSETKRGAETRQIEVAEVSSGIKILAKQLGIPIIVLSQLNRKPDDRTDGKPKLSDLRESGSIEQDADMVGLLWRQACYVQDEEKKEVGGTSELLIEKHRNGPTGKIPLVFLPQFTRFESAAPEKDAP